jgi:hypothetical protein
MAIGKPRPLSAGCGKPRNRRRIDTVRARDVYLRLASFEARQCFATLMII